MAPRLNKYLVMNLWHAIRPRVYSWLHHWSPDIRLTDSEFEVVTMFTSKAKRSRPKNNYNQFFFIDFAVCCDANLSLSLSLIENNISHSSVKISYLWTYHVTIGMSITDFYDFCQDFFIGLEILWIGAKKGVIMSFTLKPKNINSLFCSGVRIYIILSF